MFRFVLISCLFILTSETCPPSIDQRCLDETRLNCNDSILVPSDFHCCDGLRCQPVIIPATDTQDQFQTTMCVASSASTETRSKGRRVNPLKRPPVMASSWSASTVYYNTTNGDTGWGSFWYDASHQAIRTDFFPMCPFLQLFDSGVDSNYVPCSVLFYEGRNYFIYPSLEICCVYSFPSWQPDWLCQSNATFAGTELINGEWTDFWMVEWFSNFTGEGPLRNLRNMYTLVDTNIPKRFREDLDTGYLDFHDYAAGPVDSTVFTALIEKFAPCHEGHGHDGSTDRTCTRYNSQTLRRSWPCDNPTCSK